MTIIYRKNKVIKFNFLCLFFFLVLLAPSCGPYSFSGSTLPGHINTIAVPLFEDQTSEFGIKEQMTDAVINEITQDNTLKIANESAADAVIDGKIISVNDEAHTYSENEQVESYRVYITVDVEVRDKKKASTMWKERWRQWGEYAIDPTTDARQQAIQEALEKISQDILNKTVSGW